MTLAWNRSVDQAAAAQHRAPLPIAATPNRGSASPAIRSITGVRVLVTDLDLVASDPARLSIDELDRADRYRRRHDRRRFVAGRSWLRSVLAEQLGCSPAELCFRYGPFGKPDIVWPTDAPFFSLAHSENLAVLAVDTQSPVGVDIELPRTYEPGVAALVLSQSELAYIASTEDQNRAFLECWTRKEAFVKLDGRGLERRLTEMTLSGPDALPAQHGVTIVDLALDGAVGALARADARPLPGDRATGWTQT